MIMPNADSNNERRNVTCRGYVHVVAPGDTLYKIARQYDVKLFDVMRLNPYVNVYNLQIGDEICVPTKPQRPEKTYVVNEGDTMDKVLNAFMVDFETLARYNPMLREVELPEGLVLTLPLIQPRNDMDNSYEDTYENTDN